MNNIINVIDIEEDSKQKPNGEVSEIIEIGIIPIELGTLRVVQSSCGRLHLASVSSVRA